MKILFDRVLSVSLRTFVNCVRNVADRMNINLFWKQAVSPITE
jgi:hypothetical protein